MPSLREMLEKQKAEQNAHKNTQVQLTEIPKPNGQSSDNDNSGRSGGSQNSQPTGTENNRLLDQSRQEASSPPPGLSPLQLIKWKKEHAAKISSGTPQQATTRTPTGTTDNSGKSESNSAPNNSANTTSQAPDNSSGKTEVQSSENQKATEVSASQTADAQKVNDGVVGLDELRRNLKYLAENIEQKELVGQVVRTIFIQVKNNPELMPHMTDGEVDLVVRGLRRSYATMARKKQEKSEAKEKKKGDFSELAAAFADAGLGGIKLFK